MARWCRRPVGSLVLFLAAFSLGCSTSATRDGLGVERSALTNAEVMGFETLSGWSTTSGATLSLSTTHSQGASSLAVRPSNANGYTPIVSTALTTLGSVSPTMAIDIMLPTQQPNPNWYGTAQIYMNAPSLGINSAFLAQVELTGKPLNTFFTVTFPVTNAQISSLLSAGYSDLQFTVVLNVPVPTTGTYRLDNLRFLPVAANACGGRPNGTLCTDSSACTQSDTCQAGTCVGANPVVCPATDQCHVAGTCSPSTGACSNPAAPNGTACNDSNACTQSDTCQAGACVGANPVVCAAADQCHVAGVCSPSTGACSNPAAPDGTTCNDSNACTRSDACQAGACVGGDAVVCSASDQCHVAGSCSPSTGECSNPAAPDGTACTDSNACTQSDACQSGACVGGNAVVCVPSDPCHLPGSCEPATGACSNPVAPDGTACNDANACTATDSCQAGTCTGADSKVCPSLSLCQAPTCDAGSGACGTTPVPDGTTCDETGQNRASCAGGTCQPELGFCIFRSSFERWSTQQGGWQIVHAFVAGDFNGDGRPDIAMVFADDGDISIDVHPNLGGGQFGPQQRWSTKLGGWPSGARWFAGDFNGDGLLDLATAFDDDGFISIDVHQNLGGNASGGSFGLQRWATRLGGWPEHQAWEAGDFNGDGRPDLVMAFEDGDDISIDLHPNLGGDASGGAFGIERWSTELGGWPGHNQWVAGDFNRDGRRDLAVAFEDGDSISIDVHPNQDGSFGLERWSTRLGGWQPEGSWLAGDFNQDGADDLALAFDDDGFISIDLHPSQGEAFGIERWATYQGGWPSGFLFPSNAWVAGDFDGKAGPDLAMAFDDDDSISIDFHRMAPSIGECLPTAGVDQGYLVEDSELGDDIYTEEMQGFAESPTHWYWCGRHHLYAVATSGTLSSPVVASTGMPPVLDALGSDHFGDCDFANGTLFVAISGSPTPVAAAFDANLNLLGWATMEQGGNAWLSLNPVDGRLYTSGGATDFTTVTVYDPGPLSTSNGEPLPFVGHVNLNFFDDVDLEDATTQAGDVSPHGNLYYTLDSAESDFTGVHVFKLPPLLASPPPGGFMVEADQVYIAPLGYLGAPLAQPSLFGSRVDELEGVSVYPGVDGQMHVVLVELTNEALTTSPEDDVTLWHYTVNEPL